MSNSFDAVETLPEKWIQVETRDLGERVEFSVTDSGSGIPAEYRARLLQPFFTTKEIGKGTGLGLSVSRGIVEAHQGSLTLDTQCPHTRFVVSLPKTQSRMEKEAA
jgi:signal transduction histidine kinase